MTLTQAQIDAQNAASIAAANAANAKNGLVAPTATSSTSFVNPYPNGAVATPQGTLTNNTSTPPPSPNYINSPINATTGFSAANPINTPLPQPTPNPSGVAGSGNGVASGTVLGTNTTNPAPTNTQAIANQAQTAQTNPLNDPNSPLVANLNTANAALATYKQNIAKQFGAMETSDQSLPVVLGQEGAIQKQQAAYLDSLQTAVNTAQNALGQAVSAYSAQTGAQNALTTQTTPGAQTTNVGLATTVLGPGNTPIVTTPGTAAPGTALYSPTPTTYGGQTPSGNVSGASTSTPGYTVKAGDSLSTIAAQNGMSTSQLEALNPQITNPNLIQPGQQINLSTPGTGPTGGTVGSTLIGSPYQAGQIAGQQAAGQNVVTMKTAYQQATGIHSQITQLLQQNPTLNSSPASLANAINQWANSTQIPSGPYVNLLNDLQEYANTIAPVLGVASGNVTDNKQAISNAMVPTLSSGGTLESALTNLEITAAGKIAQAQNVGQNPNAPITPPNNTNINVGGTSGSTSPFAGSAWQ